MMKRSKCINLNLKDEYTRCMIPDVTLGDISWQVDGRQRECAKIDYAPRRREENLSTVHNVEILLTDRQTNGKRTRMTRTKF